MSFAGKTALLTGSTSGIGRAMAEAFAAGGANVVLNGLGDSEDIERLRADLVSRHSVKVLFSGADMTRPQEIEDMVEAAEDACGGVDILVNNAGIQFVAPVDEFPIDKWDAIIAVNLSSSFHTIRCTLPTMKRKGWGRIINTASAHAMVASPYKSAYVAAKHGLAGLTKTVALEVAEAGITANAICPGYVWTPLVENQIPDTAKARGISQEEVKRNVLLAQQPTKRFISVEEVAALAVYLASDAAASITGALLPIDGGWSAA